MIYVVYAHKYGDRERHSYFVGVYSTKSEAIVASKETEIYRGGKYECEVIETDIQAKYVEHSFDDEYKYIINPNKISEETKKIYGL